MPSPNRHPLIAALRSGKERGSRNAGHCPACGRPLTAEGHAVLLHGHAYHAGCVLYRRRGRRRD